MTEELKVIISAEVAKFKQGTQDAEKQILTFKQQVAKAGKEVDTTIKNMGTAISNAAKTMGVGIAAAGAALLANVAATEEYRNQQAQLITAFENAGGSAEQATETYNQLYRVLGDGGAATEAAQHLAKLTTTEEGLEVATGVLKGVYATFGSSLPLEGLAEAWNHTAQLGEVQGSLADALEWSGVNVDEFNKRLAEATTQGEREYILNEQLIELYWDAGEAYEENNKKILAQRDAQAALQEKLAALGEAIAPVLTAFTSLATDALAVITPYITQLAEQYLPVLQEVLTNVGTALGTALEWAIQHKDLLLVIGGVIAGVVAAIGLYNAVAAIKAAMDAAQVSTIWGLVAAHAAQAAAALAALAPYLLIVAAIAAVIAIFVALWNNCEGFRNFWIALWNKLKQVFQSFVNSLKPIIKAIVEAFKAAWEAIKAVWNLVKPFFTQLWNGIKAVFSVVKDVLGGFFTAAWNNIKLVWGTVVSYFTTIWNNIKLVFSAVKNVLSGNFREAWENIKQIFSNWGSFFSGLWNTIKGIFSNIGQAIGNAISGTVRGAINAVLSTACNIINGFISAINFAIDIINAIPGVNISRINKLSVPAMAAGGVVDSATLALIGENGKEAVMPLENNLEWLDKLAGMLNDRMGGGNKPIILQVDGKTFAQTSIESINQLTRQTGQLALQII